MWRVNETPRRGTLGKRVWRQLKRTPKAAVMVTAAFTAVRTPPVTVVKAHEAPFAPKGESCLQATP
jgi:hypothetical protein